MQISSNQPTYRQPAIRPNQQRRLPQNKSQKRINTKRLILLIMSVSMGIFLLMTLCGMVLIASVYRQGILPQVSVANINLGGLSTAKAEAKLVNNWQILTLRDGERIFEVNPSSLGILLDASTTVQGAYAQGREAGNPVESLFFAVDVPLVVQVDTDIATAELIRLSDFINMQPVDAGLALVNGQVIATEPQFGRSLDTQATLAILVNQPDDLADGIVDVVMAEIAPMIMDATPMVAMAQQMLSQSFNINIFDPVTGDSVTWAIPADVWVSWLSGVSSDNGKVSLNLHDNAVRNYLTAQVNNTFDSTRSIDIDTALATIQQAVANGNLQDIYVNVQHTTRQHIVQAGESITSIAWDYGFPYPYLQELNSGLQSVSVGQTINIPAADTFLTEPANPNKRIVVSISQQRVYVYEKNQLKWDWSASTGIPDSPTWTGIYQILSHVPNAYAGNWDLHMPNFMGVYQPIPGSNFTNGFHGFPTRGGGQLLWENSLGRKVTYGCILLSNTNIQQLYNWAETGVIVEIQP